MDNFIYSQQSCIKRQALSFYQMKKRIQALILWISILMVSSSFTTLHPVKLTSSQVLYDTKTNQMSLECKVFLDDFAPVIDEGMFDRGNASNLTAEDTHKIEMYFALKFELKVNEKRLPWEFEKYVVKDNVMTITFKKNQIVLRKGDKLYIENELLFEKFQELQNNWMTIRIPPFLPNHNFATNFQDFSYAHTF